MQLQGVLPRTVFLCLGCFLAAASFLAADEQDDLKVGVQPDGRILVPTNQFLTPAGKQVTFPGRPVDLAFAEEGRTLVVKNLRSLVFIDTATGQIKQTLALPTRPDSKVGFSVVGLLVRDNHVYASDTNNHVRVARQENNGRYAWLDDIELAKPKVGGPVHPAGMALASANELLVASTRGNNVQRVNLTTGKVEEVVPVGVAPYMVCCSTPDRCFVSNWGGEPPAKDSPQGYSSGTPIRIDSRTGIANDGTVSVLEKVGGHWQLMQTIRVGLHPSGMVLSKSGNGLYVANANSDTVSIINTTTCRVQGTIQCRPEKRLPFGSGCNALALDPEVQTL